MYPFLIPPSFLPILLTLTAPVSFFQARYKCAPISSSAGELCTLSSGDALTTSSRHAGAWVRGCDHISLCRQTPGATANVSCPCLLAIFLVGGNLHLRGRWNFPQPTRKLRGGPRGTLVYNIKSMLYRSVFSWMPTENH